MPSAELGWDQRMEIVKDNGTSGVVNGSIERCFSKISEITKVIIRY